MLTITLRGIRQNPFRYLATSIAVVLGVAFFIATGVMTTSFQKSFDSAISQSFESVDAGVRSTKTIETDFGEIRSEFPASVAEQIREIDGVADAAPYLVGYAQAVTSDGKVVDGQGESQGLTWIPGSELNGYDIVDGAEPATPTDIVLDTETFDDGDFALGDEIRVLPVPADQTFTVVGTIEPKDDGPLTGQTVGFTLEGASTILGTNDVDQILVEADPGVSDTELVANLQAAIATADLPLEALTGTEIAEEFSDLIGTFTSIIDIALKIFAGVALFVGAFVIYNTFSIIMAQRRGEMALLRAIGASGRQVSRSVLMEAVALGILASAVGAAVGIGVGALLLSILAGFIGGFDTQLAVPSGTIGLGIGIGLLITVAAAWLPARRGAAIAPIEALRESAIEEVGAGRVRTIAGLSLAGGGLVASLIGVGVLGDGPTELLYFGLPAIIIALFLLAPVLVRPVTRVLAIPLVRGGSIVGELARENATRNPKRTATTSLTLMIGVTLMVTATVFAATLSNAVRGDLEDSLRATDVVEVGSGIAQAGGGLDPSIAPRIGELDGVEASVALRSAYAEIDDTFAGLTGVDATQVEQVLDLGDVEGDLSTLDATTLALDEDEADDLGVSLGDVVAVDFPQGLAELTVAAIYPTSDVVGGYLTDLSVLDANGVRAVDAQIFVLASDDEQVAAAIAAVLASDPTAELSSRGEYIDAQAGQITNLLYLLYGLLGMSVVVALIGIVNTMALSIHERTRELGLLRAVGMNRTQLRRTIRYESALVALMGTTVGLLLGVLFGWLVQQSAGDTISEFVLPWSQLAVVAVVGVLAGVLAGVLPARRAGRLDVLDAISGE